jgi:hypothetical protein
MCKLGVAVQTPRSGSIFLNLSKQMYLCEYFAKKAGKKERPPGDLAPTSMALAIVFLVTPAHAAVELSEVLIITWCGWDGAGC